MLNQDHIRKTVFFTYYLPNQGLRRINQNLYCNNKTKDSHIEGNKINIHESKQFLSLISSQGKDGVRVENNMLNQLNECK